MNVSVMRCRAVAPLYATAARNRKPAGPLFPGAGCAARMYPLGAAMTGDQITLFAIFGGVFAMFAWGRVRYDLVAFSALVLGVVLGVVPEDRAFSGFGHPATFIVALVLIASAGLTRSGAVGLLTRRMIDADRSTPVHIALMGALGAAMSGFMNNIAALALLMPMDRQAARKAGRAAALTLMPLSFATILGGMITLIGTPPNIIVSTIRQTELGAPFSMFDYAPVGLLVAGAGLVWVALIGWRLIPVRHAQKEAEEEFADYVAELVVPKDNKVIGKRVSELEGDADEADVAILSVIRDGKRRHGAVRNLPLRSEDVLVIQGSPDALEEFRSALKLAFPAEGARKDDAPSATGGGQVLIEAVVQHNSRISGRTAHSIGLGWRQNAILMGISRSGQTIRQRARQTRVEPGDILLLLVPEETADHVIDWLGCLPLAGRSKSVTQEHKAFYGLGLFAAAVVAASLGLITMPIALGLVVVGYVAGRILTGRDIYSSVDWPVIVLLGSMIPLGMALDQTGGTSLIAGWLTGATDGMPAWVSLAVLMVVTMTLSDILNNNATTILAAPIGFRTAEQLGVNPDPFLMAVAVAASCAFLTPIGHQNNTVILGPGGYRFGDYWRMGLPLEIIVLAVGIPAILVFWPL